jgi:hypothetical protein
LTILDPRVYCVSTMPAKLPSSEQLKSVGCFFSGGLMSLNKTSKTYAIHCLRALILAQTVFVTKHMGCVEI